MVIAVECYGNNNNLNVTYGSANDNMEQKRSVNWFKDKVKWKMERSSEMKNLFWKNGNFKAVAS